MLDHKNIRVLLSSDYREIIKGYNYKGLVYTGRVDEFFDYKLGALSYRSLKFEHKTFDCERFQKAAVVNYPSETVPYTRITEFKYLTGQKHCKTSVVYKFPIPDVGGEPYYPILRPLNVALYNKYLYLTRNMYNVYFAGRLATYSYCNMDEAVLKALKLCANMCKNYGQ